VNRKGPFLTRFVGGPWHNKHYELERFIRHFNVEEVRQDPRAENDGGKGASTIKYVHRYFMCEFTTGNDTSYIQYVHESLMAGPIVFPEVYSEEFPRFPLKASDVRRRLEEVMGKKVAA
jgi:hypothetical protein